ncbi:MAG: FIST C-terminal domain-containing protein [Candidatus Omnitrophica bacterium]|nr:FIST C-terminal domain-containing protein [Candidatus Omnitrophota bacterium]
MNIGIGVSTEINPAQAAKSAVLQAMDNIYDQSSVTLAIVFGTIEFANIITLKTINNLLGAVPIIGCSSAAIITNKGIFNHGLIIMLLCLPQNIYVNTALVKDIKSDPAMNVGQELGRKLLNGFKDVSRNFTLILSDGLMEDNSSLINGLQERLGTSFPIVGASASDNLKFQKTYIYFNQELSSDAVCGLICGGKLNFGLGIKHGWKPLGKPNYVTKASGNTVYEINGASAARLYEEYFACDIFQLKKSLKRISVFYPVGIHLEGEQEYLLRNILFVNDDGSLVFQGDVPQNSMIRLMIGSKESVLSSTREAAQEAKGNLSSKPNFVLVFDSISRYILLKREANKELEIIKEVMGQDTPIIGLYTYGEHAPLKEISYKGKSFFHNQTIAVLAIGG